ncbi:hypothetical protein MTO96_007689 [Rhipicephalus appendiculatus]
MERVASPKVGHLEFQDGAQAEPCSDSNREARETPVVGATVEKAAPSRDTQGLHDVSPAPKYRSVNSDAGGRTEGPARVPNPQD